MKRIFILLALSAALSACNSGINVVPGQAYFKTFTYTGNDPELGDDKVQPGEIHNPVLQGSYSDPSICRRGSDYYMVTSTYSYFPGLAVLHSRDLVNWEQISYALPTEQQCLNTSLKAEQGVFPACIRYNEFDKYFYIVGTLVGGGGYFIIKAKDPKGPWTDPEWLYGMGGVHPSLYMEDDGTAYLLNQGNPDYVPPYQDFKAIWLQQIDLVSMKNIGDRKIILAGGDILEKKPNWLESPHLMKIGDYFYLTASEGGSLGNGLALCVYRSQNIWGPYQRYEQNPILTQRRLSPGRDNAVTSTGHTDFVDDAEGNLWAVFQGVRPYSAMNDYNQGRETFMMPVKFDNGWPYIIRNGEDIPLHIKAPNGASYIKDSIVYSKYIPHGNFTYQEHFYSDTLPMQWFHLRTPVGAPFIANHGEGLVMPLEINNIRSVRHTGFIGMRQMHNLFSAEVVMDFVPQSSKEYAGIALFLCDKANYEVGVTMRDDTPAVVLQRAEKDVSDDIVKVEMQTKKLDSGFSGRIYLRVDRTPDGFNFKYKFNEDDVYTELATKVSAEYLSAQRNMGAFYGTVIGMYASQEEGEE